MLYIKFVLICSFCVLGLFRRAYGLDEKRSINKVNIRSIDERRILINKNNNNNKVKDINESFISLENKGSIKSDLSEIRLLSFNKTANYSPLDIANIIVSEDPHSCRILAENASNPWWSVDLSGNYKIKNVEITNPFVLNGENPSQRFSIINVFVTAKEYSSAAEIPVENRCDEAISMAEEPQLESSEKKDPVLDVQCKNQIGRYVYIFLNSRNVTYGLCRVRVYGDDADQEQNINTLSSFAIRNTLFFFSLPILSTFLFFFTL